MSVDMDKLREDRRQFMDAGDWENALLVLDQMLELHQSANRYCNRGLLLLKLERQIEAIKDFEKALELDPNDKKAKKYLQKLKKNKKEKEKEKEKKGLVFTVANENQTTLILKQPEKSEDISITDEHTLLGHPEEITNSKMPNTTRLTPEMVMEKNFGPYEIISELGRGGMGRVYKARDNKLDRLVALKVILPKEGVIDKQAGRFLQEVKAIAKINHPNIVNIHDFGETPQHYYTMDYVPGTTLSSLLKKEQLPGKKIARILKIVASAIGSAHQSGVIHRDLKPSNVMIDKKQDPKVMDFGLAKFTESEVGLSQSGEIIGTPAYMPPEQAGEGSVDNRSDIYSLGAVGYEMIVQRPLFQGESVFNIIFQVTTRDPIRPAVLNPDVDSDLETIVLKCLEKSPAKRYQTMKELEDDLQRYLNNHPILAKPPTLFTQFSKWTMRNKGLAIAIAVIFLVISIFSVSVTSLFLREKNRGLAQNMVNEVLQWVYTGRKIKFGLIEAKLKEARDLAPDYFIVHQQYGNIYFAHGRVNIPQRKKYYLKAIESLKRAIELNPKDHLSLYLIGRLHESLGDKKKKMFYLKQICKIKPPVENEYGYVGRATKLMENMGPEKKEQTQKQAIEWFTKALEYNPSLACGYNGRGEVYMNLKQHKKAEKDFKKAARLMGCYDQAHINLAHLYAKRKNKDKTLESLKAALQSGYKDFDSLEKDPLFAFIKNSKEYQKLLHAFMQS